MNFNFTSQFNEIHGQSSQVNKFTRNVSTKVIIFVANTHENKVGLTVIFRYLWKLVPV